MSSYAISNIVYKVQRLLHFEQKILLLRLFLISGHSVGIVLFNVLQEGCVTILTTKYLWLH